MKLLRSAKYDELYEGWRKYAANNSKSEWHNYIACYLIYGVLPEEYICYGYKELNDEGKREFITELSRYPIYDICNDPKERHWFDNKYETFKLLKEYYNRDAMLVNNDTTDDALIGFIKNHSRFVLKPLNLYRGIGVETIDASDYESESSLVVYIRNRKECIVEEFIVQDETLSVFHPASVNTVRIPAIRTKKGVEVVAPFFRTGTGVSNVDNAAAGGVFAAVDKNTGTVISLGIDEKGNEYLKHPDSGLLFPGFQLPDWDGALKLVEKLMTIKPEIRYVGWDLAHTVKGWVVIEGNHRGQFIGQMPLHKGCAREVNRLLERL